MKARSRAREGRLPIWPRMFRVGRCPPELLGTVACAGALAVTIGLTVLSSGGFDASSQAVFVALAGATLLLTGWFKSRATLLAAQSRFALTLGTLAALCVASMTWTVGEPGAALRSGLTVAGYGAVFIAASALTQGLGPRPLVVAIAVIAAVEAILGLRGVALHATPDAELIAGTWRPGGTFEYPPAIAMLQVGAIPILSRCLERESRVAVLAAGVATLSGATIGLAASRLAVVLGATLLAILILRPRVGWTSRLAAMATATLIVTGAAAGVSLLDESPAQGARAAGLMALAELVAVAVLFGVAWLLARRTLLLRPPRRAAPIVCVTVVLLAATGWSATRLQGATSSTSRPDSSARSLPSADLLHGRGPEWSAAVQTWLDRPLFGAGSGAYYRGSLPHQGLSPTLYAHNLPLELAAELGAGGLLLAVALYIAAAGTIATGRPSSATMLLAPMVVIFLVSNLVDWTWHLAGLTAVWAAAAGGLHAIGVRDHGLRQQSHSGRGASLGPLVPVGPQPFGSRPSSERTVIPTARPPHSSDCASSG